MKRFLMIAAVLLFITGCGRVKQKTEYSTTPYYTETTSMDEETLRKNIASNVEKHTAELIGSAVTDVRYSIDVVLGDINNSEIISITITFSQYDENVIKAAETLKDAVKVGTGAQRVEIMFS